MVVRSKSITRLVADYESLVIRLTGRIQFDLDALRTCRLFGN